MSDTTGRTRIRLDGVSKVFGRQASKALEDLRQGKGKTEVQQANNAVVGAFDVSLEIRSGEIFVIMGLSGSGKSTLLRLINRLHEPTSGRVFIDDEDITRLKPKPLRELRRRKFGMVFQSFALLPHRTVMGNVEFGLEIQGVPKTERREHAQAVIETVGLTGYESRYAAELSGGMQQRVGLARALAADPEILLMDEAFSALDPLIRSQLQDDLLEIQDRLGKTIVFVSHDLDEALKLGSRIAIMRDGRLIQVGTPEEIIAHPADDYVSAFVEGADRTQVLTAAQIMRQPTTTGHPKDSPRTLLRKMERSGFGGLVVVDNGRQVHGFVGLDETIRQRDNELLNPESLHPLPVAEPETNLSDLINLVTEKTSPVVVLDPRKRLVGVIDKSTLLAALAQGDAAGETAADPPAHADTTGDSEVA
ncbi:glycine/betaine ABC transporter ATP-binding protein [Acidihalobacter aeolianus]|uniref:Quaternary amine transport ATP-binding protein n=1 Tax=Acidihalobacter aeolianus TaxID=2792603 RepID=A0A1D8KAX6_9GAMM|nr:glycine betaine/L-proline ABC transporter ATP-binding protein [Acidihalobacter aeolianus]AOV18122.1 glycine/betaine ABC transporter ATP-binding protein [Acidihalobacter aeolianus]